MTSKEHSKHAKIKKPAGGKIHRNEFGFVGAPCGIIQELTKSLANKLDQHKVGYVDAAHNNSDPVPGFYKIYTDKIDFHSVEFHGETEYDFRALYNDCDLVLINGNHFVADQQIVLINQKKKESLHRKLDRLTNVLAFILDEEEHEIHDFLKAGFSSVPILKINEISNITDLIERQIQTPKLNGLVLTGGKSTRMGTDKGMLEYHGKPQREHAFDLLSQVCEETFLSTATEAKTDLPQIVDSFTGLGPYSGILSAFRHDPNAAWLVVATDIPLLDSSTLDYLIAHRNTSKYATCFHNPETNFPEPLITIWEPRAYSRLLQFLSMGYSCPRKALINSDIEEIHLEQTDVLRNANTPEEREDLLQKING